MTVAELIVFLQTQPQDLQVINSCCSEFILLEAAHMSVNEHQPPRADGWVHCKRPDKPTQKYFCLTTY